MVDPKRTLCDRCVKDYRYAGFSAIPDNNELVKDSCDICGRPGNSYVVEDPERNGLNGQS